MNRRDFIQTVVLGSACAAIVAPGTEPEELKRLPVYVFGGNCAVKYGGEWVLLRKKDGSLFTPKELLEHYS